MNDNSGSEQRGAAVSRHLLIVTGASRGLGAALAEQAVDAGHEVLAIARSRCGSGDWLPLDLADSDAIEPMLERALAARADAAFDAFTLVNNAATIDPIGHDYGTAAADAHLRLNLLAPIVLTRVFLRLLAARAVDKRVVNISSGAAVRAFDGWSLYCAAKAGLDHFGRCVALEQQRAPHPADIVNVSPGVIDTDMQQSIRRAGAERFPAIDRFIELHRDGALATPESVATRLLRGIIGARRFDGATVTLDEFAA